jgi:hypothetical protein
MTRPLAAEEGLQERREPWGEPLLDGLGGDVDAEEASGLCQFLVGGAGVAQEAKDKGLGKRGRRELAAAQDDR